MQSERNSALHLFDGLGEVDAEVVVGIEAPGDGDQGLSEVGVDGPSVREHRGNEAVGDAGRLPTPRELEAALRDMGFSRRQSRAFMAKGFSGLDPEAAAAEELAERIHALTDDIRSAIPTP